MQHKKAPANRWGQTVDKLAQTNLPAGFSHFSLKQVSLFDSEVIDGKFLYCLATVYDSHLAE